MSVYLNTSKGITFLLVALLVGLIFQGVVYADYEVGDRVDNFTLFDMDGNVVNLYDYEGYAILINFFAWW